MSPRFSPVDTPSQLARKLNELSRTVEQGGGVSGVAVFNGRSGTVALSGDDVTGALGFTPQAAGSYTTLADLTWANITGKPSTFTPPTHSHAIADVTSLQTALDGKQAAGSYAASVHSHAIADVTGLQGALDAKQAAGSYVTTAGFTWTALGGKPATFAPSAHAHAIADITGLQAALDGKAAAGSLPVVRTRYTLSLAHSNNTVTPSTIGSATADTDWVHTLVAGKAYRFTVWANYQAAALTTGGRMNLLGAGGLAGTVQGMMWGGIAQAAAASTLEVPIYSFANGAGSFLLTTAVNPINSPHIWGADFVFVCTTGGTLALQWASEVAASAAQLNVGSTLLVEEL